MKSTILRLAVTVIGALWCEVQQAQSQDHVFANPPMLSSRDGRLDVDLVASPGTYTINGHQFQGMLYNSAYIPPVWRVRLRDTLTVTLHNRLSEPTNLHFHGLGVSPLGNGDNIFLHLRPGETFTYHIENHEEEAQTQSERHDWNISRTAARCGHCDLPPGKGRYNVQHESPPYFASGCICLGCICSGPCPDIIAIIPIPIWGARSSLAVFF